MKKGFAPIILIAVLALVIAVGGVGIGLAWKTNRLDKWLPPNIKELFGRGEKPKEEPEEEPGEEPEEKPEEDATKDWKTFENESFGISFKYPKTYQITKEEGIEVGKFEGVLILSDETRFGNPSIHFRFNPEPPISWGAGPCMNKISFISYKTVIEGGKVKILSREISPSVEEADDPKCEGVLERVVILFQIGDIGEGLTEPKSNWIFVSAEFKEAGVDYEPEIKQIIGTIRITKEESYGK